MFVDEVMTVKTTRGDFRVMESQDENYPGVHVYFKGELVSIIELDEETGVVRTIPYEEGIDEAVDIINFNNKE